MYSRILVALDGSETAAAALDAAIRLAHGTGAELLPLYVIDIPAIAYEVPGFDPSIARDAYVEESRIVCADAQTRMTSEGVKGTPRSAEVELGGEDVAQCIERIAADWRADLIVMGTHGRRGVRRLVLGSVAERVLRSARCPVLLIPLRAAAFQQRAPDDRPASIPA
ncbi:universal stress protein [Paraburkholderia lycopersici]|uniref:Nucleotide-binding universal stress protein, UspA family n=1 Tax=Paraburkholderia lycopersici TaxID=416944 RepID=A0A1G6QUP1_9BURK|nr:universal stress protein [Paraburkholderia lycopersici]SDC96139.1 Nucleotide-binding universal stress protein, UspA family [Paraburkholderia lycopersici]